MSILIFLNLYFCFLKPSLLKVDNIYQSIEIDTAKQVQVNDALIKLILKDPDNLINQNFKVPNKLANRVFFWTKVYGVYSSKEIVIHDREDLSIVYKVLDYSNLWNDNSLNKYQKVFKMRNEISNELNKLRNILNLLLTKKPSTEEEIQINNLFSLQLKNKSKKEVFEKASKNIRAQTGQKDFFVEGIISSGSYMEQIEKIFYEQKLPIELSRLSFVESSFNINAVSKVGAKGLWQIMDETGEYYLELSKHIDERVSPIKASRVAAKILKQDYRILKSWPLAVTAYNFGAARLRRAESIHKTKDLAYLIDNFSNPYFGFAVKNFYASFLAALYVYSYHELLFGKIQKQRAKNLEGIVLQKALNINAVSNILGLTVEEISMFNPDLKTPVLNGNIDIRKGFELKLPKDLTIKLISYFIKFLDNTDIILKEELNEY